MAQIDAIHVGSIPHEFGDCLCPADLGDGYELANGNEVQPIHCEGISYSFLRAT